jgi:hypothetical protein
MPYVTVPIPNADGNAVRLIPDPYKALAALEVLAETGQSMGLVGDRLVTDRQHLRREVERRSPDQLAEAVTVAVECLLTGRQVRDPVVNLMLFRLP